MSISEKIETIRQNIEAALKRSPYGKRNVTIMGASKDQSLNKIREAHELGVLDMGENYAQELLRKAPLAMDVGVRWHFFGRLQSNKIKHLLPFVSSIDSVDSIELATKIDRLKSQLELKMPRFPIMLQVNVGQERQKSGLAPHVIEELFPEFLAIDGVEVVGIMSIPPVYKEPEKGRDNFKLLKELFDRLKEAHPRPQSFQSLSMGMSGDYEIAVEEGSNCIRLGTALFGPRPQRTEA